MNVNTKLDYQNYLTCVESIADSFFDADGRYIPHIGRIMSMSLFLDYCVINSGINMEEDNMIDQIFDNEEILMAFDNEVKSCMESEKSSLRFGNAFIDAMEIVAQKKGAITNAIDVFANQIQQILTPENLEAIKETAKNIDALLDRKDNVVSLFPDKER